MDILLQQKIYQDFNTQLSFDNLPPDIMIIYMGNNDALVQNLNTANFEKSYRNMLNNLYTLYPNIQLFLGTLSYEKYFVGKDYYEEHVLVTAEVNRIIQSLASEYNLPIMILRLLIVIVHIYLIRFILMCWV